MQQKMQLEWKIQYTKKGIREVNIYLCVSDAYHYDLIRKIVYRFRLTACLWAVHVCLNVFRGNAVQWLHSVAIYLQKLCCIDTICVKYYIFLLFSFIFFLNLCIWSQFLKWIHGFHINFKSGTSKKRTKKALYGCWH